MPDDLTPEALAAMPLSEWDELEKADPGAIKRVFAALRRADEEPARARKAAARVAHAAGDAIARDPGLTSIYIQKDAERRAAREQQHAEEVARLRSPDSFPTRKEETE
jgi:hypothetical protein